ncbi:MAG: hypothetical protein WAK17_30080 [Candidatus Nitrosopolaris sp.]
MSEPHPNLSMPQFSTPLHDLTHSWVFNNNNRFKVLQSVALKKGFNLDKENYSSSIDIERPIFYKETVRKFIVDGVIDLVCGSSSSSSSNNGGPNNTIITVKSFAGKDLRVVQGAIYRRFLYEIKPKLDSISAS